MISHRSHKYKAFLQYAFSRVWPVWTEHGTLSDRSCSSIIEHLMEWRFLVDLKIESGGRLGVTEFHGGNIAHMMQWRFLVDLKKDNWKRMILNDILGFGTSCFLLDFRTTYLALFNGLMTPDTQILVLQYDWFQFTSILCVATMSPRQDWVESQFSMNFMCLSHTSIKINYFSRNLNQIVSPKLSIYPAKTKCIQYSFQNYNQLRTVDKILIFERNRL